MNRTLRMLLAALALTGANLGAALHAQQTPPAPLGPQAKLAGSKAALSKPGHSKPALAQPVPAEPAPPRVEPPKAAAASAPADSGAPRQRDLDLLKYRNRNALHPGEPLTIRGDGDAAGGLRARSPLLARAEHTPLQVDTEVAYQRALAIYGDRAAYHAPLPPAVKEGAPGPRIEPTVELPQPPPPQNTSSPAALPRSILSGFLVSGLLIGWFLLRLRPALMGPKREALSADGGTPARSNGTETRAWNIEPVAPLPKRKSAGHGSAGHERR